jgi:hypothetical protein
MGQSVLPNDFEVPAASFGPLFAYFGGVQSFGVEPSTMPLYSGASLRAFANFRHDNLFRVAGFAVGTLGVDRGPGGFTTPANPAFFSVTIKGPEVAAPATYAAGQLQLIVTLREDDDGDGVIDIAGADDEWESANIAVLPGTNVYNIPMAEFADTDPVVGNGVQNFGTTGRMAAILTFETRTTYPGGIIESPRAVWIDHAGLFAAAQALPTGTRCAADVNRDGSVTVQDLFDFLGAWFGGQGAADFNNAGGVTLQDVFDYLGAFFTPCP